MRKILASALAILFISTMLPPVAQSESAIDAFPPELRSELNDILSNALNGLVIFSSSSAVGGGSYTFKESGEPDGNMDVIRLWNDYYFGERGSEGFVPYVRFGVGHLTLRERLSPVEGEGLNDFWRIKTTSLITGFGTDINLGSGFYLTPGFDLIYSHSTSRFDYNNEFSQEYLQPFDRDIFSWNVDTLSYNPQVAARYEAEVGRSLLVPSVSYTQVFVDSLRSSSELLDVNTSSGVLNTRLRAQIPSSFSLAGGELFYTPKVSRTDLYRDARDGLGFGYYHELGFGLLAKDQDVIPLFRDIGFMAGYSFASGFRGWRVGLEADL